MKSKQPGKTRTAEILELAEKEGGQFFLHEAYRALNALTKQERQAVWKFLRNLVASGKVERVGEQLYEAKAKPTSPCPMRDTIWRAIRIHRQGFTIDDLILSTDCARETAKELIIDWRLQGWLKTVGWRRDGARNLRLYKLVRDQVATPPRTWKKGKKGAT
jgi:hypothetical protein